MNAQLETQDTEVQDVAEEISGTLEGAFDLLIGRRGIALAAAIKPLDDERDALEREAVSISEARVSLERLLPARARVAQSEADALSLAGDSEGAEAKLQEAQESADAPAKMNERQREISGRIEAIDHEKRAVARRVFASWYEDCQAIIRPIEHGLFVVVLDGLEQSFYDFQTYTGTGGISGALVKLSTIQNLTSPERSEEWRAATRWYSSGGR